MTISWIEKLFHRLRPENRSLSPDRDVVPRSVLITPPRMRTVSSPAWAAQRATPSAPVAPPTPPRKPDPAPDFSDSGFGLVSPCYQPPTRRETVVYAGCGILDEARGRSVSGGGDFVGGGAESSWPSSESSSSYSGD